MEKIKYSTLSKNGCHETSNWWDKEGHTILLPITFEDRSQKVWRRLLQYKKRYQRSKTARALYFTFFFFFTSLISPFIHKFIISNEMACTCTLYVRLPEAHKNISDYFSKISEDIGRFSARITNGCRMFPSNLRICFDQL